MAQDVLDPAALDILFLDNRGGLGDLRGKYIADGFQGLLIFQLTGNVVDHLAYFNEIDGLIDKEVKALIQMIHDRTLKILTDNKEGFLALATVLLEKEVIFAEDLENIFGPRAGAKAESVAPTETDEPSVTEVPAEAEVTPENEVVPEDENE